MAEEMKSSGSAGDVVKGDFSTILVGVGSLLDSALTPLGKLVAETLDSLAGVAKQILEGVNTTLGNK
ncbi:MAG: hypothetical protein FDX30_03895 [Chlorobium sp.]|jgi:hypothetical protein|nr:hypothetical protein [Chlorobiaceae bacterium]TLU86152.1 MAG: hypothetical protein FDX30_03895 [Chlorobium sp.]